MLQTKNALLPMQISVLRAQYNDQNGHLGQTGQWVKGLHANLFCSHVGSLSEDTAVDFQQRLHVFLSFSICLKHTSLKNFE